MSITHTRLLSVILALQVVVVTLHSQRQGLALSLFIIIIILAPLYLQLGSHAQKTSLLSSASICGYMALLAFISNLSYLGAEIAEPFRHWLRLLYPLILLAVATKIFQGDQREIKIFVWAFAGVLLFAVYKTFDVSFAMMLNQGISRQTNWGNAIAAASPFVFLIKRTLIKNILLLVAVAALIASLKRTGMMTVVVLFLAYLIPVIQSAGISSRISKKNLTSFLGAIVVFSFGALYILRSETFEAYLNLAHRRILLVGDDGGSGRLTVWLDALNLYSSGSVFELVFGRGFGWFHENSYKYGFLVESLHNDAVEFLISFGILGLFLYGLLLARTIFLAFIFVRSKEEASFALSVCLIFIIYSMFAGVFFYIFFFTPLFIGIGYLEARRANAGLQTPWPKRENPKIIH